MEFGVRKTVLGREGRYLTGCYGCDHCEDTGYSWVCCKTGEKLEGFDTAEDKRENNLETFLKRNIMVGVGHKCPLCVVTDAKTKIRFDVPLTHIRDFVERKTSYVYIDDDDMDENKLIIGVQWIEGGYPDDDAHRDWVQDELSRIVDKIEDKYNVKIAEGNCEFEREEVIISL